jgi:hypothetical protein
MPKIIKGIALAALVLSLNGCYSRANTFVAGNYSIRLEWLGVHGIGCGLERLVCAVFANRTSTPARGVTPHLLEPSPGQLQHLEL